MTKSSAYNPLDSLVDLACRDGVDIRPTLLRVLTDLYVQKPAHSPSEETQYVELARGLIDVVDAATRATIASRLAAYPAAPREILEKLSIVPPVPARQVPIEPKPQAKEDLMELFFAAKSEERRLILANLDTAAQSTVRRPVASGEMVRRLETAALARNAGEFARMLERALGINRKLADRIAHDAGGEPIVVAARALSMPAEVLHRVLLFLNPAVGQSVERVYDLARLFDDLTQDAAERMVAIWREATGRARTSYDSLYWDDERRDARTLSTPARYRSDRGRVTLPSHTKTAGK